MEKCIERVAGKSVATIVMEGNEQITEKTDGKKTAEWVKDAIKRLEASVDERTREWIMQNCGYNCAEKNRKVIERAIARRNKFANTDNFLAAEQKNPMKGTGLVREGNTLYQSCATDLHPTDEVLLQLTERTPLRRGRLTDVLQLLEGIR